MVEIPMSLPLDSDGFLRRECPTCERQFKWLPSESSEDAKLPPVDLVYYCPYCYEPAAVDAWWTKEQIEYQQALIEAEVIAPSLQQLQRDLKRSLGRSKVVSFKAEPISVPEPVPLVEPEDMVRVELPCHLEEPLKVDEAWEAEVGCLACGLRYPVDLVRELPEAR